MLLKMNKIKCDHWDPGSDCYTAVQCIQEKII